MQSNTLLNLQNQLSQIQLSLRKQSSAEVALLSQMQVYISKMLANERERPKIEKALLDGLARLDEKMETFSLQKTASAAYRAGSSANHNPRRAAAEPAAGSCQSAQPMAIDNDTTCVNAGSSTSGRTYSGPSNDEIIESQAIQPTDNDEPFKTGMELLGEAVSLLQQSGSPLTPRKKGEASGGSRPLRRSARKRSNEEEQVRVGCRKGDLSSSFAHSKAKINVVAFCSATSTVQQREQSSKFCRVGHFVR